MNNRYKALSLSRRSPHRGRRRDRRVVGAGAANHHSLTSRNQPVSPELWLGSDWLGRDMFARTLKGFALSIGVGFCASLLSVGIAVLVAGASSLGLKPVDWAVSWIINCFLGLPSIVLMLILAFAIGGGFWGIVAAAAISTWPSLARILQAQALKVRSEGFVIDYLRRGRSRGWVAINHVIPSLLPHIAVGLIVGFPHAILHEAALSFLGFGFDPATPSLGIILNEAPKYITSGQWWLILAPVVALVGLAVLLDRLGNVVRAIMTQSTSQD